MKELKSDEVMNSLLRSSSEIKLDFWKEESLEIDLSACCRIPLEYETKNNSSALEYIVTDKVFDINESHCNVNLQNNKNIDDVKKQKNKRKSFQPQKTKAQSINKGKRRKPPKESEDDTELILVMEPQENSAYFDKNLDVENGLLDQNKMMGITSNYLNLMENSVSDDLKKRVIYFCHNCNQTFPSRLVFDKHYKESYNKDPVYMCRTCDKQIQKYTTFRGHCYRHANFNKFKCKRCPKAFMQKRILEQHEAKHDSGPQKCSTCKLVFDTFQGLKVHLRSHVKVQHKETKFPCPQCGKFLRSSSSLLLHRKIHEGNPKFNCDICGKKFVQKNNLLHHIKAHNGDRPYSCTKCNKSFVEKSHLRRHQNFHITSRLFKCNECGKMYKTERCLKVHSVIHLQTRPYVCMLCSKGFISSSKLKQHSNIHTGQRPFKCQYCIRDFTNFPNWLKHVRRTHKVDHKTGAKLTNEIDKINKISKKEKNKEIKILAEDTKNKIENMELFYQSNKDDIDDLHPITISDGDLISISTYDGPCLVPYPEDIHFDEDFIAKALVSTDSSLPSLSPIFLSNQDNDFANIEPFTF